MTDVVFTLWFAYAVSSLAAPNVSSPAPKGPSCQTNRCFTVLCTFSTSHTWLYHQIENRVMCMFVHNTSISHPQPGRLATRWQGRVPLRCTLVKDKASKQNRLHCSKRRNFQEQGINADPERGRERLNWGRWRIGDVRIIQQQQ